LGSGYGKLACFVRIRATTVTVTVGSRVACLALSLVASAPVHAGPSNKMVLARAAAYVESQVDLLPQLVAEERSTQSIRSREGGPTTRQRTLVADFAWTRLEGTFEALGVREVREVDGQAIPTAGRLDRLLRGDTPGRYGVAQQLVAESARYNLAPGSRNLNVPTITLFLLHRDVQPRFKWRQEKGATGTELILSFKERDRPTVIRGQNNEPVFSYGRIWLDPGTGNVSRTELHADVRDAKYVLVVQFAVEPALGLLLPQRMEEHYQTPEQIVEGLASYVNYRRFQTAARLVR
jgi:hypothetical protein